MTMIVTTAKPAFFLTNDEKWLVWPLHTEHRVVSWAVIGGGLRETRMLAWHQVKNSDLPLGVDPAALVQERRHQCIDPHATIFLTSARLDKFTHSDTPLHNDATTSIRVIATVGLSNACHVNSCQSVTLAPLGTINIGVVTNRQLTDMALFEALSIATEARTAAVIAGTQKYRTQLNNATGTGTDCIAIASRVLPKNEPFHAYCGKHTAFGQALGRCVYSTVLQGVEDWLQTQPAASLYSDANNV